MPLSRQRQQINITVIIDSYGNALIIIGEKSVATAIILAADIAKFVAAVAAAAVECMARGCTLYYSYNGTV